MKRKRRTLHPGHGGRILHASPLVILAIKTAAARKAWATDGVASTLPPPLFFQRTRKKSSLSVSLIICAGMADSSSTLVILGRSACERAMPDMGSSPRAASSLYVFPFQPSTFACLQRKACATSYDVGLD